MNVKSDRGNGYSGCWRVPWMGLDLRYYNMRCQIQLFPSSAATVESDNRWKDVYLSAIFVCDTYIDSNIEQFA